MTQQVAGGIAPKGQIKVKSIIGIVGAAAVFALVWFLPIAGVEQNSKAVLAALAAAIVLWITETLAVEFTALLLMTFFWVFGYAKPAVAYGGFSTSTWWLLFAALGIGTCVTASGFAKRLALTMMRAVGRPTYKRVLLMIFVVIFLMGYVMPSSVARAGMFIALLAGLVPLFGVGIKSNVGKMIYLMIVMMCYSGGTQTLTGTARSVTAAGLLEKTGHTIGWAGWAAVSLVPTVLVFVILYFVALRWAKPEANEAVGGREKIAKDLAAMGPMTRKELWGMLVTFGIIAFWIADQWLKIGTEKIALVGVFLYLLPGIGVISFGDFLKKQSWGALILCGCLLSLGSVLSAAKLQPVIEGAFAPLFGLATNQVMLLLVLFLTSLLVYPIGLATASLPILVPIVVSAATAIGVSPVIATIAYNSFLTHVFYIWTAAAVTMMVFAMKDGAVSVGDWVKMSIIQALAWLVAWLISIFTWVPLITALGLVK